MNIGPAVRAARERAQLRQDQLAELMHVSQGTVSDWERGRREPDVRTFVRIATVCKLAPTTLLRNAIGKEPT